MSKSECARAAGKLRLRVRAQAATSREMWAEESCVDYERDSDDEWFECFDADDLEDAKEEEEEEEVEGEDDRDWLEDDEDPKDKLIPAPAIKFESFLRWNFSFDGEHKPNEADCKEPGTPLSIRQLPGLKSYLFSVCRLLIIAVFIPFRGFACCNVHSVSRVCVQAQKTGSLDGLVAAQLMFFVSKDLFFEINDAFMNLNLQFRRHLLLFQL